MKNRKIVAGAPCSGKSTYVKDNATYGDLIYDYDTLHQALSGLDSHIHSLLIRPFVLAARDEIFRQLEAHKDQSAYVITSSRKTSEIEGMAKRLDASIVFIDIERGEAHRRASNDYRPNAWHEYIDNWFNESDIEPGYFTE